MRGCSLPTKRDPAAAGDRPAHFNAAEFPNEIHIRVLAMARHRALGMSSWYRMNRGWMDHPAFKNEKYNDRNALLWLIESAEIEPGSYNIGAPVISVRPGQILCTIRQMSTAWIWRKGTVTSFLNRLRRNRIIDFEPHGQFRLITLIGYPFMDNLYREPKYSRGPFPRDRRQLTKQETQAVYDRDGNVCAYCQTKDGPFNIDHVHPVCRGGSNDLDNLVVSCVPCNQSKGSKSLENWGAAT